MSLYAPGTFTGRYGASSPADLAQADHVIGHEFAPGNEGFGYVNVALATFIAERYSHLPIFAAVPIAAALREIDPEIELAGVLGSVPSNAIANQGGTWGELQQARLLVGEDVRRSIHVGHAYHVGRIVMQARKAGLEGPLVPPDLPTEFDPNSTQWWCRSPLAWGVRETLGTLMLRSRGHL